MPDPAETAILTLLASRAADATICPSEAARALTADRPDAWRDAMPQVHAAIDRLLVRGAVRLSWKGATLATRDGPYRIRRAEEGISVADPAPPPPGQRPQDV